MKILILTTIYRKSLDILYSENKLLEIAPYKEQKEILESNISMWANGWSHALSQKGFEVFTVSINAEILQKKWAEENKIQSNTLSDIAYEQIKSFQPDILWYDHFDLALLVKIKSSILGIKLFLGWSGSAVVNKTVLQETDVALTCAPEVVKILDQEGIRAEHLDHAFDSEILKKLRNTEKWYSIIFIGQLIRGNAFHNKREEFLTKLLKKINIVIFSPTFEYGLNSVIFSVIKKFAYIIVSPLFFIEFTRSYLEKQKYSKALLLYKDMSFMPFDFRIKKYLKPAVYGIKMLQTLRDSEVVLNIHADSSPEYASNMRLFEATGVGSCLLTDWKTNMEDYFEDGKEVVTYKTVEECVEKAKWLLRNPEEARKIGTAGQKRTLRDHTFTARASELVMIITNELRRKYPGWENNIKEIYS
jgi:spore maturation protein CgeB